MLALYKELKKSHGVTVAAPHTEKSSVGHGITLAHPIWHEKVYLHKQLYGYSVTGTPADCVKFAVGVIMKKAPDLVISGINRGSNDGCSVFYSGTVAGAREGALEGIPAFAISLATLGKADFTYSAKMATKLVRLIKKHKIPKGTFLNVNVPNKKASAIKGIKFTQQGLTPIQTVFQKRSDPNLRDYYWMTGDMPKIKKDLNDDTYGIQHDYVTVTPIQSDLTDYQTLTDMQDWTL